MVMATFKNISASVLLVKEKGVPGENHRPAATHWQDWIRNLCRGLRNRNFHLLHTGTNKCLVVFHRNFHFLHTGTNKCSVVTRLN
jgi:hypothetical protein